MAARAATFATNGGNTCAAFAGDVANVAAIACAKSGLASMARTSSAMLLSCAANKSTCCNLLAPDAYQSTPCRERASSTMAAPAAYSPPYQSKASRRANRTGTLLPRHQRAVKAASVVHRSPQFMPARRIIKRGKKDVIRGQVYSAALAVFA